MEPNTALRDAVHTALKPQLGRYSLNGQDRGAAFKTVLKSFALTNEGLPAGTQATGLEVILALYPDPSYTAQHEFGDVGLKGILYYACTLKGWGVSVMLAYEALMRAFPLMTLASHRPPRQVATDLTEALTVWLPWQT